MYRTLLCVVILSLAIPSVAQSNCAELIEKPNYPPLARQAFVQGKVKAHFDVGSDGRPLNLVVEGHPLFQEAVKSAINETTLDAHCQGTIEVIYSFALSGEMGYKSPTSIVFNPPNEFLITTYRPPPISDPPFTVTRRSWFRRLFHL
jgi:hypothetical protein